MRYSVVVASHKYEVLEKNLLASPNIFSHDLHIQFAYGNICRAYNKAVKECAMDIIIFVHHDVFLPETFFKDLDISLGKLDSINWGVLGAAGKRGNNLIANVNDRGNLLLSSDIKPTPVDTIDELILIVKKSSFKKMMFDEDITNNHLFGTDLCLQAKQLGMTNYIIDARCDHNSSLIGLPANYQITYDYIKTKWVSELPIHTTCSVIK